MGMFNTIQDTAHLFGNATYKGSVNKGNALFAAGATGLAAADMAVNGGLLAMASGNSDRAGSWAGTGAMIGAGLGLGVSGGLIAGGRYLSRQPYTYKTSMYTSFGAKQGDTFAAGNSTVGWL